MDSGEHPALMMDSANCLPGLVSHTYFVPDDPPRSPPPTSNYSYFIPDDSCISVYQRQRLRRLSHLQSGWDAGSGCLPACPLPSSWDAEVGDRQPTVLAPALRFPRDWNAAAAHRAHQQTRAQMIHPGALCCWVAHYRLSGGFAAGAGRKHVCVLRTSQTLQSYFISVDAHYKKGTHTLS